MGLTMTYNIRDYLEQTIGAFAGMGNPALIERFVLRNGREWEVTKRIERKLRDKECFSNSLHRANQWFDEPKYEGKIVYVEGFAYRPGLFPMLHAWVGVDDKAVDPTWNGYETCMYFGVPFDVVDATKVVVEKGYYGLFDGPTGINYKWMFKRDPGLLDEVDAAFPQFKFKEKLP